MKTLAILIHGFNTWDRGAKTTDTLKPFLEASGVRVVELDYRWTGLIGARRINPKMAKKVKGLVAHYKALKYRVIVIGHSNGAAIAYLASKDSMMYETPDALALINPALDKHIKFGKWLDLVLVFYSHNDKVTPWAKRLSKIIPKRWFDARPWGEMGTEGYIGEDDRVNNIDLEDLLEGHIEHSTAFDKNIYRFKIINRIMEIWTW